MAKPTRELRTIAPTDLRRVRGGLDLGATASAPSASGHEREIELHSWNFGTTRPPS